MTCNYSNSYFYCIQDFQVSTTLQSPNTLYPFSFLRFDILRFSPQEEHLHFPASVHTFPHQSDNMKPLDFIKGELEKLRLDHGHWEWKAWENPQACGFRPSTSRAVPRGSVWANIHTCCFPGKKERFTTQHLLAWTFWREDTRIKAVYFLPLSISLGSLVNPV